MVKGIASYFGGSRKKRAPARTTQDNIEEYDTSYLRSTSGESAGVSGRWNEDGSQQGSSSSTGPVRTPGHRRIVSDPYSTSHSARKSLAKRSPLARSHNSGTRNARVNHQEGTTPQGPKQSSAPLLSLPYALSRDESYPMSRGSDYKGFYHDDERCPMWLSKGACIDEGCPYLKYPTFDPDGIRNEETQPDSSSAQSGTTTTSYNATRIIFGGVRLGAPSDNSSTATDGRGPSAEFSFKRGS